MCIDRIGPLAVPYCRFAAIESCAALDQQREPGARCLAPATLGPRRALLKWELERDVVDLCSLAASGLPADFDGDGIPDVCDWDDDNDADPDALDPAPFNAAVSTRTRPVPAVRLDVYG
jgi:hypothetical protein